jgi:hypothetical protein
MTVILLYHLQLNIHLHHPQQQSQVLHHNIQVQRNICEGLDSHHHYVFKQVYHHNVVRHGYGHHRIFILIQCGLFLVLRQRRLLQHQNDYLYKIHHRHHHHHHHHHQNQINVQDDNVVLRNRLIVTFIFCL